MYVSASPDVMRFHLSYSRNKCSRSNDRLSNLLNRIGVTGIIICFANSIHSTNRMVQSHNLNMKLIAFANVWKQSRPKLLLKGYQPKMHGWHCPCLTKPIDDIHYSPIYPLCPIPMGQIFDSYVRTGLIGVIINLEKDPICRIKLYIKTSCHS